MQLTCTAWVESLNARDGGREKTCRSVKNDTLYHCVITGRHLPVFSFITNLKSNLYPALTTQNNKENTCFILQVKKNDWNASVAGHKQGTVGCPQVNRKGKGKVHPRTGHEGIKGE